MSTARAIARSWMQLDAAEQPPYIQRRTMSGVWDGTPGVRDIDAPCKGFEPGTPAGDWCETDGHYLCQECVNAPSDLQEPVLHP